MAKNTFNETPAEIVFHLSDLSPVPVRVKAKATAPAKSKRAKVKPAKTKKPFVPVVVAPAGVSVAIVPKA